MGGPAFVWLSNSPDVPRRWDLRQADWSMRHAPCAEHAADGLPGVLDWRSASRPADWCALPRRGRIAAIGVDDAHERARLLDQGLGDALGSRVGFVELVARISRLSGRARSLPRLLQAGPVALDLFHRDGRVAGRWLGLHPREFALLWRLAETPGIRVPRKQLLREVWRLDHVPETNSLDVHVSRLRAKLHVARCAWLVETDPLGGYRLATLRFQLEPGGGATGLVASVSYEGDEASRGREAVS